MCYLFAFQPRNKYIYGKIEISLTAFAGKLDARQKQLMGNGIVWIGVFSTLKTAGRNKKCIRLADSKPHNYQESGGTPNKTLSSHTAQNQSQHYVNARLRINFSMYSYVIHTHTFFTFYFLYTLAVEWNTNKEHLIVMWLWINSKWKII